MHTYVCVCAYRKLYEKMEVLIMEMGYLQFTIYSLWHSEKNTRRERDCMWQQGVGWSSVSSAQRKYYSLSCSVFVKIRIDGC